METEGQWCDSNSRSKVCVKYAGPMELWNDALGTPCAGQRRRRWSHLRLSANTAMLSTACFLCVIGHRELLDIGLLFAPFARTCKSVPSLAAARSRSSIVASAARPAAARAVACARGLHQSHSGPASRYTPLATVLTVPSSRPTGARASQSGWPGPAARHPTPGLPGSASHPAAYLPRCGITQRVHS